MLILGDVANRLQQCATDIGTCFYYHQNQNTTGCMNSMLPNILSDYTIWEGCHASVYYQVKFDKIKRLLRKHS